MIIKKELPHQGAFLQAPYVFPEIRFFFEICGYAAGKTSSLGDAIMKAVAYFMGKKDKEGKNPKIGVCGITLTFLQKTLSGALEQMLRNTKSSYKYDKKANIIYIGNVELHLTPIENEGEIFGFDWACIGKDVPVATLRGEIPIKDVVVGDYVLTTKGYKRVVRTMYRGLKETIDVNGIRCTPDHRFIDIFNNEIEAQDLTKNVPLVKLNTTEVLKWEKVLQEEVLKQTLWNSMVLDIIGIQKVKVMEKEAILPVLMSIKEKVTQRITETCGESITEKYQKGMIYTILTETILIILLKTLNYLREENTLKNIIVSGLEKGSKSSLKVLKKQTPEIKSCLPNQSIEKEYQKLEKKLQKDKGTIRFVLCVVKSLLHTLEKLSTARIRVLKLRVTKETEKCLEKLKKQERATYVEKSSGQVSTQLLQRVQPLVKMSKEDRRLEEVYDIEVEEAHEFFAGDIRVHNCCFVDELDELPTHTCIAVVKALNDRCRQAIIDEPRSPFLAFTTTSQGLKGTYQTIMNFRKIGMSYMIIRGRTRDNIYLQKEYVDAMYKMYNEKETKCLLEGEFISIDSGLVFPDYNPAYNKLNIDLYNNLEPNCTVHIGQDFNFGFNKAVACIVKDRNIYVIKTYSFGDAREAPEVFRYDFPEQKIIWIPDMTYKDHFGDFARELKSYGIRIAYRKCNPNIVSRNFAINKMFYARRLFVCDMAEALDNALLIHQKDPKTGLPLKGQGENAPDHLTDALAYVVAYLIGWKRELKDVYDVTMGRALKKHREIGDDYEDEEDSVNAIDNFV